jgi:hypothetical protein
VPAAFAGAQTALLADAVSTCNFGYSATGARGGVVTLAMRFTRAMPAGTGAESVELVLSTPVLEP